ncbi:MAG TPA: xanthine dehydrogenase family protein molybdopterin-binding subunit [Acidimicrobiales bacterium]
MTVTATKPGAIATRRARTDARAKATGRTQYVADLELPGMVFAAVARSTVAHGRILSVDTREARRCPGVVDVYTAQDFDAGTYGRSVRDVPVLAGEKVRFVGERVAAVVASTREQAEAAAALVVVEYEELPAVFSPSDATREDAPLVHDRPWDYPRAFIKEGQGRNLQSVVTSGSREDVAAALSASAFVVDETYVTVAGHQGYLEPQACIASVEESGRVLVWITNKSPFVLRGQLAECLSIDPSMITVHPVPIGGDFGGKGSPGDAPLCIVLSRIVGRPVKMVLRYSEDLTATDVRHPVELRVRLGCDREGHLTAWSQEALLNGGAYGGFKPVPNVNILGATHPGNYRIPAFYSSGTVTYTNTVPKGHMRAPGSPQMCFATESALDELASVAGIDPVELRRRNLLHDHEGGVGGHGWVENRGLETLERALAALRVRDLPPGWSYGWGLAIYSHPTASNPVTSLRLVPLPGDRVRVELPLTETGTGSHTVARELVARSLGIDAERIEVAQVSTDELPRDFGASGSRLTSSLALAVDLAAKAWFDRSGDEPVAVDLDSLMQHVGPPVGSYCVQIAQVAVDPETGQLRLLEILTAVDVAEIINPKAHQMQVDGGVAMGVGFACSEDLDEQGGQVWAANLGEFKLPSSRDLPDLRTVLVGGGIGVGTANVKHIGETANVPTAAAVANAIANAVGLRLRRLPLTAERIYDGLRELG